MRYFTVREFDSRDEVGSGNNMKASTLIMLDDARHIAGIPFKIVSGYRTLAHNTRIGGSKTSSHMKGFAADIYYDQKKDALRIIAALHQVGFRRMGLADTFIHVDNDPDKPEAYWDYD